MKSSKNRPWLLTRRQLVAGRQLTGLGLRQLAAVVKLSPTAISQIENGHTLNPHPRTLESLAFALMDKNIHFAPGGWVRHGDDELHPGAPFMSSAPISSADRARLLRASQQLLGVITDIAHGADISPS